jgi:hypothetical protein
MGTEYVLKAAYNKDKDLVFITKTIGSLRKKIFVYERHYLEQTIPSITSSWSTNGLLNNEGILTLNDLRTTDELYFYMDRKYWNPDERQDFLKSVTTYWRGLKHKDVNMGLWFNNSDVLDAEHIQLVKKTNEEVKAAIAKHGPLNFTDYDLNYRYQLEKRVQDLKKEIVTKKVAFSH